MVVKKASYSEKRIRVCRVITSKVCKYFRQYLVYFLQTLEVITPEFRFESLYLSDFGGNNYIDFQYEIVVSMTLFQNKLFAKIAK